MWTAPIVEEIRRTREEHAAKFNYDLEAIYRDLKERKQRSERKVVSLSPKRPARVTQIEEFETARGA